MGDGTAAAVTGATGAQQCHNQFRGSQQGLHQQGQLQQNQQQSQFQQMYFVQMPMMMPAGTQVPLQEQGQAPMLTTALPATTMMPTTAMPVAMPTTAMMPAGSLPQMTMTALAPNGHLAPWVSDGATSACGIPVSAALRADDPVQGEVVQQGEEHGQGLARGIPEQSESQSISAAGKQLFGEALDERQWDASTQDFGEPLSGTVTGPIQSPGSVLHGTGNCNPCAWFWKPRGCACAVQCDYCHLCPEGELKRRKKMKIQEIKSGAREPVNPREARGGPAKGCVPRGG